MGVHLRLWWLFFRQYQICERTFRNNGADRSCCYSFACSLWPCSSRVEEQKRKKTGELRLNDYILVHSYNLSSILLLWQNGTFNKNSHDKEYPSSHTPFILRSCHCPEAAAPELAQKNPSFF